MTNPDGRSPRTVLIFTCPKAGSGQGRERVAELADRLATLGVDVSVESDPAVLQRWSARHACDDPSALVVAAGGDGTLALVARELPSRMPIVPLPLGTENLVALHFGYSQEVPAALATILGGNDFTIDAGTANDRLFLVMATCGFDAEVVRAMHLTRRGHIRRWSYLGPILRAMRRYRFPELVVTMTDDLGQTHAVRCGWAMVFNLPCYALSLSIEPDASGTDGRLDVIAFTRRTLVSGFRYLAGVLWGSHIGWGDVVRRPIRSCQISSRVAVAYQLDGDYAGKLPLEIRVLPERIRLRLPPPPLAAGGPTAVRQPAESTPQRHEVNSLG
ncbi:MAG: protein BmrU [Planctomycetaceae bacterium]|nr:MAG: protein BmrU [Planctomycetaceae bacterium]